MCTMKDNDILLSCFWNLTQKLSCLMTVRPSHVPVPLFTLSSKANSGEKKRKKKTKHVTFRVYPTLLLIFVVLHSFLSVDSFLDLSFHFPFSFPETIYGFTRSFQIQPCNTGISHIPSSVWWASTAAWE